MRVETRALIAAILEARLAAEETMTPIEFTLPVVPPDPDAADRIEAEIAAQEAIIAEAEAEADRTGGLIQAVALSSVQSEKLTLARLRGALMQARYGAMIPAEIAGSMSPTAASPQPKIEQSEPAEDSVAEAPPWADPDYPDIDYNAAIFQQLDSEGSSIHGWWGLPKTRAEIDHSARVFGLRFQQTAVSSSYRMTTPGITIGCSESIRRAGGRADGASRDGKRLNSRAA